MTTLLPIFALLLGAILGSFLNALSFRYNTGKPLWSSMQGRSRCMRCAHVLHARDLVPVLSWLYLQGRCRYCRAKISIQYPLVELMAALLSLGVACLVANTRCYPLDNTGCWPTEAFTYVYWLLVWMTVLFLVVYDWRHMILPLGALMLLDALAFGELFFSCQDICVLTMPDLWQLLSGPLIALPLATLSLVSRGRWMGWGDGILALGLGWMVGVWGGITALMLAFWIGAAVGIALIAATTLVGRRAVTMQTALPFGPFLALGAALVFFGHVDLFTIIGWWQ